MTAERYEIKTVHDFANIPKDRRATCLREFLVWLGIMDSFAAPVARGEVGTPEAFIWIDDDLHTAKVSIALPDGVKIPVFSGVMKGFN